VPDGSAVQLSPRRRENWKTHGRDWNSEGKEVEQASQAAEKVVYFVIPSEARNLSSIYAQEKKERFLASLGMKI
jgi:hypothetical protein